MTTVRCPRCHREAPELTAFCVGCGAPLLLRDDAPPEPVDAPLDLDRRSRGAGGAARGRLPVDLPGPAATFPPRAPPAHADELAEVEKSHWDLGPIAAAADLKKEPAPAGPANVARNTVRPRPTTSTSASTSTSTRAPVTAAGAGGGARAGAAIGAGAGARAAMAAEAAGGTEAASAIGAAGGPRAEAAAATGARTEAAAASGARTEAAPAHAAAARGASRPESSTGAARPVAPAISAPPAISPPTLASRTTARVPPPPAPRALDDVPEPEVDAVEVHVARAEPWRRVVAWGVDGVPFLAAGAALAFSLLREVAAARGGPPRGFEEVLDLVSAERIIALSVAGAVVLALATYATLAHALGGATLGKRLVGIRVVGPDGGPPSPARSAIRSLLAVVSAGLLGLGFVLALFTRTGRALHDVLARTWVVKAP